MIIQGKPWLLTPQGVSRIEREQEKRSQLKPGASAIDLVAEEPRELYEVAWAIEYANTKKPPSFVGTGFDFYNTVFPPKAGAAAKVAEQGAEGVPVDSLAGGSGF